MDKNEYNVKLQEIEKLVDQGNYAAAAAAADQIDWKRVRNVRTLCLISEIYEEEKNIKAYFMPFDSYFFNQSLRLSKVVGPMIDGKTELLLKTLFDYHIEDEKNPYVRQMAPLLLNVTEIRGDFNVIAKVLAVVLDCEVEYKLLHQDELLFVVHKRGMNSKEYLAFMKELKPLFDFVQYWFVPMEMDCVYKVKDYGQAFVLSSERALVLDYNTQI